MRHLKGVHARGGFGLFELGFRMVAIHLEGIRSYLKNQQYFHAFKTYLVFPLRLIRAILNSLLGNFQASDAASLRRTKQSANAAPESLTTNARYEVVASLLFSIGVIIVFLGQFTSVFRRIVEQLATLI